MTQVEIRDDDGEPVDEGVEGEIHVRSPLVMLGYWRNPEATAATILPGRWLRTGDIGQMRDGQLFLAARRSDLILRGGENVYPAEIENCLEAHPAVREVASSACRTRSSARRSWPCRPDRSHHLLGRRGARLRRRAPRRVQGAVAVGRPHGVTPPQRHRQAPAPRPRRRRGADLRRGVGVEE